MSDSLTEREVRMLGLLTRMHSAWTATSISREVTFDAKAIHKAVSAESILRYCLKKRAWTESYRAGKLTDLQHVELLKDIAEYCEAWLLHEANAFATSYLARALDIAVLPMSSGNPLARSNISDGCYPTGDIFELMGRSDHCSVIWRGQPPDSLFRASGWFRSQAQRFFGRLRQFVREGIVAGAMSLMGPAQLSEEDLDVVDREVTEQVSYLTRFENDVIALPPRPISEEEPGPRPMSPEGFVSRVGSYGASVFGASQRVGRASAVRAAVRQERRILGDPATEHCPDCPELAAKGWQEAGVLPDIGTVTCRNRCLCHFEYRFYEDGPSFTRVRGGVYNPVVSDEIKTGMMD